MARRRRPDLLVAALVVALGASAARGATERAKLASGDRAALVDREELFLEALPRPAEGWLAFCRRLTGVTESCGEIMRLNRSAKRLLAGQRYRVPYSQLSADLKLATLRALFPEDRATPEGWIHRGRGEDLSRVAEWLAGDAARAAQIRAANGRKSDRLAPREEVRVPDALLLAVFRVPRTAAAPRPPTTLPPVPVPAAPGDPAPAPRPASPAAEAGSPLGFGADGIGPYAIYRLRGGEALYSAVVVRFTGRLSAEDVNELAAEIALRSGIVDVTDIPIGYPIKIPRDLLQPEFLPADDPRRLEWEVELALAEKFRNQVEAKGLQGVTVILDSGHGGADVGAARGGSVGEQLRLRRDAARQASPGDSHPGAGRDHDSRRPRLRDRGPRRAAVLARPPRADHAALRDRRRDDRRSSALVPREQPAAAGERERGIPGRSSSSRSTPIRSILRCAERPPTWPTSRARPAPSARRGASSPSARSTRSSRGSVSRSRRARRATASPAIWRGT